MPGKGKALGISIFEPSAFEQSSFITKRKDDQRKLFSFLSFASSYGK